MILWARIPSYLAGFCRELQSRHGHEVRVLGLGNESLDSSESPVSETLFRDLRTTLLSTRDLSDSRCIVKYIESFQPDVIFISGWQFPAYRSLYGHSSLRQIPKILCCDNTRVPSIRQYIGKFYLQRYFRNAAAVWVPGRKGRQLMAYWNVPQSKLVDGLYNVDEGLFENRDLVATHSIRRDKAFVFVGQLIQRKGFDLLVEAYQRYRSSVDQPWRLIVCGRGPLEVLCKGDGIDFRGFVDGSRLPGVFAESDVFVLPSLYDSWGVVIAEAACAGLPIIATDTCGAAHDLIEDGINGLRIESGSCQAILDALHWAHESDDDVRISSGNRSRSLAKPYTSSVVAAKISSLLRSLKA
ncbi:MAG: glycosyltransferase family 4 protein [Planctomycetales bacterium]|nr:glycosyltransferase family 4 protein [Planctomycetales bacterium]